MVIKAVIFDVDGVVINSTDSQGKYLWSRTIKDDLSITKKHFQEIFSSIWQDITKGKYDTKDHLSNVLAKYPELNITADIFISYWLNNDSNVNHEIIELIKSIKTPIYLGTNQDKYRTAHIKKLVGKHFNQVFSTCELGYLKPENQFYQYIERTLKLPPNEILIIDDTLANIVAAKECGWQSYYYQNDIEKLAEFLHTMSVKVKKM